MSAPKPMVAARFRELLAAYGADFARWPDDERAGAEALAATSREAALWLAEERKLDALLELSPAIETSASLLRNVAEIPVRNPRRAGAGGEALGRMRNWILGLAAAAAMGAFVGVVTPDASSREDGQSADGPISDDVSPLVWAGDLTEELDP